MQVNLQVNKLFYFADVRATGKTTAHAVRSSAHCAGIYGEHASWNAVLPADDRTCFLHLFLQITDVL